MQNHNGFHYRGGSKAAESPKIEILLTIVNDF